MTWQNFLFLRMFKAGMNCIDDYKARCLTARQQQVIERGVAGARHTFAFLCDDPVFQAGKAQRRIRNLITGIFQFLTHFFFFFPRLRISTTSDLLQRYFK